MSGAVGDMADLSAVPARRQRPGPPPGGETEQFFHTEKQRLTDRTCVEREREIDAREYEALLAQRDPARVTIHKMRYCLPEGGLVSRSTCTPSGDGWR